MVFGLIFGGGGGGGFEIFEVELLFTWDGWLLLTMFSRAFGSDITLTNSTI